MGWHVVTGILVFVLAALVFYLWLIWSTLFSLVESRARKRRRELFEEDFRLAVVHSQPKWEELQELAELRGADRDDIMQVVRVALREIVTGRETDLIEHEDVIRQYLDEDRKARPFDDMAETLRGPLQKLADSTSVTEELLDPLTSEIQSLLEVNNRERRRLRFYTAGGFFVGVSGLLLWLLTRFGWL